MTFRLAQISDTHLSNDKPFFVANFERMSARLRADRPDLIVNTGDLSLDGSEQPGDLDAAKALHDSMDLPYCVIPGNHDVGENVLGANQTAVSDAKRDRFNAVFGADWWTRDVPGWRLIGLNCLIMGSGLRAEMDQNAFLAAAVGGAAERAILLLTHKPLYRDRRDESKLDGYYLWPKARAQILEVLSENPPKLICSGHLHQSRSARLDGIHHVWAPATSFIVPAEYQPTVGDRMMGYVEHSLHPDGSHDSRVVHAPELTCHSIVDFPDAYGDITKQQKAVVTS